MSQAVGAAVWRVVLAAPPTPGVPGPANPPGAERGEEFGKTSPLALVVILLLGLATVLLVRSMNKRLRNVPASFDGPGGEGPALDGPGRGRWPDDDDPVRGAGRGPRAGPTGSP